jgi:nucleoside 2-deoxyribosyltransferase
MRKGLVYLSGPITGLSYDGCTEWREKFAADLKDACPGVHSLNPMRGKYYLQSLQSIEATGNEKLGILSGGPQIVTRDYSDTVNSDMLVVNLVGATKVSIGTMFEVAWAFSKHIPIVLVIEEGNENIHAHSMLFSMCGYRVNNLDDALTVVISFFK